MFDFYLFPLVKLELLFSLALLLFILQSTFFAQLIFNNPLKQLCKVIGEFLLLLYISILTLLPIIVVINRKHGIITLENHNLLLYIFGILTVCYFLFLLIKKAKYVFIPLLGVCITLPTWSILPYNFYQIFYVVTICLYMSRSLKLIGREYRLKKNKLSPFSIREGLDTLPAGIMLSKPKGYIYLLNRKMDNLLIQLLGKEQKNATKVWSDLEKLNLIHNSDSFMEGDILVSIHNAETNKEEVWCFSRYIYSIKDKKYVEIIAIDITETFTMLTKLASDKEELIKQGTKINELSEKITLLSKENEFSRIRIQLHDIMGQKLTTMQRLFQSEYVTGNDFIADLLHDLLEKIKIKNSEDKNEILTLLKDDFKKIGLEIKILGELPKSNKIALLFLGILREICTNAIKHGEATKVSIEISNIENSYDITITNNGSLPKNVISEGSGLNGIRERLKNINANLDIDYEKEFTLHIKVKG